MEICEGKARASSTHTHPLCPDSSRGLQQQPEMTLCVAGEFVTCPDNHTVIAEAGVRGQAEAQLKHSSLATLRAVAADLSQNNSKERESPLKVLILFYVQSGF